MTACRIPADVASRKNASKYRVRAPNRSANRCSPHVPSGSSTSVALMFPAAQRVKKSTITAVLWWIIGLAGLWLGLLGIAMAVGLARVLRSGAEIPEAYWRTLVDYRSANE